MLGVVKWFDVKKGFGFVRAEGKDYFIHFKEIKGEGFKSLTEGNKVIFDPSQSAKGAVAKSLVIIV
jgi:CspA family cold shock protein